MNKQLLVGVKTTIANNDELLLVDDIVASGTTVGQAIDFIRDHLPEASLSFLPMFNRSLQYLDAIKDVLLWLKAPFRDNREEARKVSGTSWTTLPYLKDIRSAVADNTRYRGCKPMGVGMNTNATLVPLLNQGE